MAGARYTARMKLKTTILMIALSLPLAGCGNKGPLVLPQAPVPDQTVPVEPPVEAGAQPVPDAPPADPVPAEPAPAEPVPGTPVPGAPTREGDG